MIWSSSSISTGLLKPKRSMLRAICLICFRECVRAFPEYGRSELVGRYSKFMVVSCKRAEVRAICRKPDPSAWLTHGKCPGLFMSGKLPFDLDVEVLGVDKAVFRTMETSGLPSRVLV